MTYIKALLNWRMLIVLLLGFSSGLPLLLIGGTLKIWFTRAGIDLTLIGLLGLVGLPYTWKFLWAPFLDRYTLPFLGRRRGWIIVSQIGLALGLLALAHGNPSVDPGLMAWIALGIAFFSATQDIGVDAYRREILSDAQLGFGNSLYVSGYRIAILVSNAGALFLADMMSWKSVYMIMAALVGVGFATILFAPEPKVDVPPPKTMAEAFWAPLKEYFSRPGAWMIVAFILLYKIGDSMAAEMTSSFYVLRGYTNTEIGGVVKVFGIWALIAGSLIGGAMMIRLGLIKALWIFGILQAVSTVGFAFLTDFMPTPEMLEAAKTDPALIPRSLHALALVVSIENLTGGMGTTAFVAFLASLTNKKFTATQFALLTSLMAVPRIVAGAPTGWMAKTLGWAPFFVVCTLIAIPGLLMLIKVGKYYHEAVSLDEPAVER